MKRPKPIDYNYEIDQYLKDLEKYCDELDQENLRLKYKLNRVLMETDILNIFDEVCEEDE